MKNKLLCKRLISCALAFGAAFSVSACGKTDGPKVDGTKTQLAVAYYNGGLGRAWLDEIVANFEAKYANTSFESGKMGVQIIPDYTKTHQGISIASVMKNAPNDIYILEDFDYYDFTNLENAALDITDIVTAKADESEEKTIEEKLLDTTREYYNKGTDENPSYYALPWYTCSININYNVDLFEKKGYYFKKDMCVDTYMVENDVTEEEIREIMDEFFVGEGDTTTERSYGPDGKTGTVDGVDYSADDGLPATYADFFLLMDYMDYCGTKPFIWGKVEHYWADFTKGLWADNEGKEQMALNYTLEGTAENLITFDGNGNIIEDATDTPIDVENGYELQRQRGKYYALEFVKRLVSDSKYYKSDSFSAYFTDAQKFFVKGGYKQGYTQEYGMLIDGTWWESEADSYGFFDETGSNSRANRKFGIMPWPKATVEEVGTTKDTRLVRSRSGIIINPNKSAAVIDVAKKFVAFMHTNESLNIYARETSSMRPFEMSVTEETYNAMSYYGKQAYTMHNSPNVEILSNVTTTDIAIKNNSLLTTGWYWELSSEVNNPFTAWKRGVSSAKEYIEGMYRIHSTNWSINVKK